MGKPSAGSADSASPARAPRGGDDNVLELMHALVHDYRALQFRRLRAGEHGVTHMDAKVLGYFGRHPGATQSDLVQHSGRDKAQVARLIKGLRDAGLLEAQADEQDRRVVRLALTPEGEAVQKVLRQQSRSLAAKSVAGLSAQERTQLAGLLQRVRDNLNAPD